MEPCAVVATSCNTISPQTIVEGILGVEPGSLANGIEVVDSVKAYPWNISTKYYSASIHVCTMEKKTLGSEEFADNVNAFILCFDSHSSTGLSEAEQWLPFFKEFQSEVKILVCDYCYDVPASTNPSPHAGIDRVTAVTWGIKHGFELVELNPQVDADEDDLEDDFPETVGLKRIVQALEAHIWPNMVRKGTKEGRSAATENVYSSPAVDGGETTKSTQDKDIPPALCSSDEEDEGSFEALFEQLSALKCRANDLPPDQRKDYAEKVAVAFWRAIGGDEAEIEDLGMGGHSKTTSDS